MINYDWRYKTSAAIAAAPKNFVKAICTIDANEVSDKPENYVQVNSEQYYVATNTWLLLSEDLISSNMKLYLQTYMKERGLIATIRHAAEVSQFVVNHAVEVSERFILDDIPNDMVYILDALYASRATVVEMLQVLRYLKRFTPNGMSKLAADRVAAFAAVNTGDLDKGLTFRKKDGTTTRRYPYWAPLDETAIIDGTADRMLRIAPDGRYSHHLRSALRDIIAEWLDGYGLMKAHTKGWSNGASQDTCTCEFCKNLTHDSMNGTLPLMDYSYSHYTPAGRPREGLGLLRKLGIRRRPLDSRGNELYASQIMTVPKDYKGPRIIAPEAFDRQYRMKQIAAELEECLKWHGLLEEVIPLHNQTHNQLMAFMGALTDEIATLDLSHASDSVTKDLVYDIFPKDVVRDFIEVMPTHYEYDGNWYPLYIFGTMGSALTFIVESIVFAACAKLATEYGWLFNAYQAHPGCKEPSRRRARKTLRYGSYGDDIYIDNACAETLRDILAALGFEVNVDKSYGYGLGYTLYRESCGREFLNVGEDTGKPIEFDRMTFNGTEVAELTTIYWPRKDMSQDIVTWDGFNEEYTSRDASWLSLANRLYGVLSATPTICNTHNFLRLWLHEEFGTEVVPPQYADGTMLIGDTLTGHFRDLLTKEKFEATWSDYLNHPTWRFACTTARGRKYVPSGDKPACVHRQLTVEQMDAYWEYHCYQHWLQFGPQYESDLDEILRIPSKRPTMNEAMGSFRSVFTTRYTG